ENASLRSDGDADLVGHVETAGSLEMLVVQEGEDEPLELAPILLGQRSSERHSAVEDGCVLGRERPLLRRALQPTLEKTEHDVEAYLVQGSSRPAAQRSAPLAHGSARNSRHVDPRWSAAVSPRAISHIRLQARTCAAVWRTDSLSVGNVPV